MDLLDLLDYRKVARLDLIFAGRDPLDDRALWKQCFKQHGVALDTLTRVRRVLAETLRADFSRIRDTDDFSKEFAFFWDMDSLADLEVVVGLESEFAIKITDAEAAAMKTLRDIVLGVHAKLRREPIQDVADRPL